LENDVTEEWTQYVERMDHYFEANDIEDKDKKRSIFLSVIGAKTYKLLRGLIRPEIPNKLSYEVLSQAIRNHYVPKPSVIVQRYKFNTRVRGNDESISTFMAELRTLSEHCEFGVSLDEMLRDRLVCGVNEDRIQRRLLAEPVLDLKKALEIAHGMETAAKDVRDLKGETPNKRDYPMNKLHGGKHSNEYKDCYRCGGKHDHSKCRFKTETCHKCGKMGHIAKVCRSSKTISSEKGRQKPGKNFRKKKGRGPEMNKVEQTESDEELEYNLFSLKDKTPPYSENLNVNGMDVNMEIDTGASFSVINEKTFQEISRGKKNLELKQTEISLVRTFTGEKISPKGITEVVVEYNNQVRQLPVLVLNGSGPNLIGRNWLEKICLNWTSIKRLARPNLEEVLNKYDDLFTDELGKLNGVTAKIYVDPSTKPIFCKARSVPYTIKPKIEKELERLERQGTIEPVQYSEWATPVVPIMKPDGSVRLCGDYKVTVNKVSRLDTYPVPKIEEIHNKLAGGKTFTELDLSHAYEQMVLDDASKGLVTINTHRGLYRYNRLPYGVSSAPGIFQRTMESLLNGIPYTGVLLDNIVISGSTDEEHLQNLEEVMKRLSEAGLRLKKSKCRFMQPILECLGYRIDKTGIYPVEAKVKAVQEAPAPTSVTELKAYLGLLNFYGKFIPNLSTELEPLYQLLRKNQRWKWHTEQIRAFERSKTLLQSATVLVHYDPNKKLTVSCDASPYGVGAVLSHEMPDGSERPIAFASRTLTSAEKKYSQLDKEGLAVVFAVKKFHQFLYGRHYTIYTDHKPLLGIFKCDKPVPLMVSGRIQRWILTLAAYEYDLVYRPGKENGNADALSRLPLKTEPSSTPIPQEVVNLVEHLNQSPVDALKIKQWTMRDPVLAQVLKFTLQGWPSQVDDENVKPYFTRKEEISVQEGCLLWGSRVVVPP
jgi:predicted aspartyl protease